MSSCYIPVSDLACSRLEQTLARWIGLPDAMCDFVICAAWVVVFRFVVIASDGVFEFLTNQNVADMVARYDDPLEACKKVVQEAYDLWLQYEVRTDDITIICIYIGEIDGLSRYLVSGTNMEGEAVGMGWLRGCCCCLETRGGVV